MNGYPTVAIQQPTLPSPLPTDHQALMDIFYASWQAHSALVRENNARLCEGCNEIYVNPNIPGMMRSPHQDEIAAVMPAKVNAAVMLGNMNYQVCNGGWMQWDDNGYSSAADSLLQLLDGAAAIGIEDAADVADMMRTFMDRLKEGERTRFMFSDDEDEDGAYQRIDEDLCTRFYAKDREDMCQAILDRFEECVLQNFGAAAFKKAA